MKNFLTLTFTVLVFLLLLATGTYASTEGEHVVQGIDNKFIFTIINFFLLFIGLYFLLRKPAKEFFANRSLTIKSNIETAQKLRDETYRTLEEIEAKLKNADNEGKNLIQSIKNQSEKEKQHLVNQSHEMSKKIKADTQRIAKNELLKAKKELQTDVVRLASKIATDKIKEQITEKDHVRLGVEFATQIKKVDLS